MYAIITNIKIDKFGLFSNLGLKTIEIDILSNKITPKASSQKICICFKCTEKFPISVIVKKKKILQNVVFEQKCINLTFLFENISVEITLELTDDLWSYFDPEIKLDQFESAECAKYLNKKYYINQETLETSFEPSFSLEKSFPSFYKAVYNENLYYVDSITKMVIKNNPSVMKASILQKMRHFINENAEYSFMVKKVQIDRQHLLETAFRNFLPSLKNKSIFEIFISFKNEIGEDQGALRREFLYLLFNALVSDEKIDKTTLIYDVNEKIECPDFVYFYYNRNDQINIIDDLLKDGCFDSRMYFVLLGVTFACLLLLSELVDVNFSLIFFENLLNRKYSLKHIQDIELQRNLARFYRNESDKDILTKKENQSDCYEKESNGEISVLLGDLLIARKKNQYDHIKFGFDFAFDSMNKSNSDEILSRSNTVFLRKFTAFDLSLIFYHYEKITVEKLKKIVKYINCDENTQEIKWFWEELENKDQCFMSRLILFMTGSGNLTNDNLMQILSLERVSESDKLFRASACVNRLYIPRFTTKEKLSKYLEISIKESEGYHFI